MQEDVDKKLITNNMNTKLIKIKGDYYNQINSSLKHLDFVITYHMEASQNYNIVFIHGLAGSSDIWHNLMHQCYLQYNIYALDLPWNGKKPIGYKSSYFLLKWLEDVLDSLKLLPNKTCIIAHSFGATMVLSSFLKFDLKAYKLILCAPTWKNADGSHIDWIEYKEFINNFEKSLYEFIRLNHKGINDEIVDVMVDKVLQESSPRQTLSFIDCLFNIPDIPTTFGEKILTLIIYGGKDEVVSTKHSNYLQKMIANSKLVKFPHSGHYIMLDNVDEFNDTIINFLKK